MGVVSPLGNDIPAFWDAICSGKSGIRRVDRFDASSLTTQIAGQAALCEPRGMSPKDVRRRDLYTLFALIAADQAWEQSGIDIDREIPERCGANIGSGIGGIVTLEDGHTRFVQEGPRHVSPFTIPKLLSNIAAGEVAIRFGLRGPNKSVVSACATGAQSITEAANVIRLGQADVMLGGGAEASISPFAMAGFCAMRAMSRRNDEPERASRPFDADRDGFVMGEGSGVVVLESEEHARKRGAKILADLAGFGETSDAYHVTAPLPDGAGAAAAMRIALDEARVNVEEVDYFNAHGTSTRHNDISEAIALRKVFGESMPPVSSTKSMMGHLLGAAGAVEAIVCILSVLHGILPPSINYETPDPECIVNLVANHAREAKVEIAMSNSLGFGGHNASILFRRYNGSR
jgi:3-oxoacyl-[acyl-carrier-protein] synthase II